MTNYHKAMIALIIILSNGALAWITDRTLLKPLETSIYKINHLHQQPIKNDSTHKKVSKPSITIIDLIKRELTQHHLIISDIKLNHKKSIVIVSSSFIELMHILQQVITYKIHCESITIEKSASNELLKTKLTIINNHSPSGHNNNE